MAFLKKYFLNTTDKIDVVSIVHELSLAINEAKVKDGIAVLSVTESGAAITILEPLPEIINAMNDAVSSLSDWNKSAKNKRKEELLIAPRIASAIIGKSISISIHDGRPILGLREEPVLIDMERSGKRREFTIHIVTSGGGAEVPPQMMAR